jgi:hypothetical protein
VGGASSTRSSTLLKDMGDRYVPCSVAIWTALLSR